MDQIHLEYFYYRMRYGLNISELFFFVEKKKYCDFEIREVKYRKYYCPIHNDDSDSLRGKMFSDFSQDCIHRIKHIAFVFHGMKDRNMLFPIK